LADEYLLQGLPSSYFGGLVSFAVICCLTAVFAQVMKKRYDLGRHEIIQVIFVFFLTLFLFCMLITVWFRGAGMQLMWPWQVVVKGI
jgi:hypothetical protein